MVLIDLKISCSGGVNFSEAAAIVAMKGTICLRSSALLDKNTGRVNFDNVLKIAKEHKPKLIICGGCAYPRYVEFE